MVLGLELKIDEARFIELYENAYGEKPYGEIPDHLEALFEALSDPTEFDTQTAHWLRIAKALVKGEPTVLDGDPSLREVTIFPGDVEVHGDFTFGCHVLILGDLRVKGVIVAPPAHYVLMVCGDIECEGMNLIRAYGLVTGHVRVANCAVLTCYGRMLCGGTFETSLYIADETWQSAGLDRNEASFDLVATHAIVGDLKKDPVVQDRLGDILYKGALAEEAFPYSLFNRVRDGEPVLR